MVLNPQDRSERSNPEENQTPTHNGLEGIQSEGRGCDLGESGREKTQPNQGNQTPHFQRTERGSE